MKTLSKVTTSSLFTLLLFSTVTSTITSATALSLEKLKQQIITKLTRTESGLSYAVLKKGSGEKVASGKEVAFHWTGYFENGQSFGSSRQGQPFYFITGKNQVIKGTEEGLAMMREGDRYLLIMPPELAYGEKGSGKSIPPNATLSFDYEVISVSKPKLSIGKKIAEIIQKQGINEAIKSYHLIKKNSVDKYTFREGELNNLGYQLMGKNKLESAIKIFKLNAVEYPDSWNVHDSLGEAYLKQGNKQAALNSYKKSLTLNPTSPAGIKAIKMLEK